MTLVTDKYKVKTHIFIIDFNKIYIPFLVPTRWKLLQVFCSPQKRNEEETLWWGPYVSWLVEQGAVPGRSRPLGAAQESAPATRPNQWRDSARSEANGAVGWVSRTAAAIPAQRTARLARESTRLAPTGPGGTRDVQANATGAARPRATRV
jgi:hypothetical protein